MYFCIVYVVYEYTLCCQLSFQPDSMLFVPPAPSSPLSRQPKVDHAEYLPSPWANEEEGRGPATLSRKSTVVYAPVARILLYNMSLIAL